MAKETICSSTTKTQFVCQRMICLPLAIVLAIFVIAEATFAQKDVASLNPKHAAALQGYLEKHKGLSFFSVKDLERFLPDNEYKGLISLVGKNPLYVIGDFNRDRIGDFGIILLRSVQWKESEPPFRKQFAILESVLVVFNGTNRGFVVAHEMEVDGPFHFISFSPKDGLVSSCTESDADTILLAPAGKGYIEQFTGN